MPDLLVQPLLRQFQNLTPLPQKYFGTNSRQSREKVFPKHTLMASGLSQATEQVALQIIKSLQPIIHSPAREQTGQPLGHLLELVLLVCQALICELPDAVPGRGQERRAAW